MPSLINKARKKLRSHVKRIRRDFQVRRDYGLYYEKKAGVIVPLRNGVGNKLLQYCMGRILSDQTGLRLDVRYRASKHEKHLANPWREFLETFDLDTNVGGSVVTGVPRILGSDSQDKLMSVGRKRPLVVYGQFFRYEYIKRYKDKIRHTWLRVKTEEVPAISRASACVHMRFGDLADINKCLNAAYYCRAIEAMDWDKLVIVTDDPQHGVVKELARRYGALLVSNRKWGDDFRLIYGHKRIAICESTFSWWAAWLSNAELIVCPGPELDIERYGGHWPTRLDKNHPYVDDEDRYFFLN